MGAFNSSFGFPSFPQRPLYYSPSPLSLPPIAPPTSSGLSSVNQDRENFLIHLVTSQHTDTIDEATLVDHWGHHVEQSILFDYFKSHPTDFTGLSNYQNLAADAAGFSNTQSNMAQQAAWYMRSFPGGATQAGMDSINNITNQDQQVTGFKVSEILDVEKATMDPSLGITAQNFIDSWGHITSEVSKNNVTLADIQDHIKHHTEQAAIFNALVNDPNITDTALKATATKYAAKNTDMATNFQWFSDHFGQIAGWDGNSNSISTQDMQQFLTKNATPQNGGTFTFAAQPPLLPAVNQNTLINQLLRLLLQFLSQPLPYFG